MFLPVGHAPSRATVGRWVAQAGRQAGSWLWFAFFEYLRLPHDIPYRHDHSRGIVELHVMTAVLFVAKKPLLLIYNFLRSTEDPP